MYTNPQTQETRGFIEISGKPKINYQKNINYKIYSGPRTEETCGFIEILGKPRVPIRLYVQRPV